MKLDASDWIAGTSGVIALAGIAISVASARIAHRSRLEAKRSADAAQDMASADQARRHDELTPHLRISGAGRSPGSDRVVLTVRLDGPPGLDRLDEIALRIRDDQPRQPVTPGEPRQEQIDNTIWGPYRFVPGADGAGPLGREVAAFALTRGESRPFELEPSPPPPWYSSTGDWSQQYAEQPIRLEAMCRCEGGQSWRITKEINQPQARFDGEAIRNDNLVRVEARNVGSVAAQRVRIIVPAGYTNRRSADADTAILAPEEAVQAELMVQPGISEPIQFVNLEWVDQRGASRLYRIQVGSR